MNNKTVMNDIWVFTFGCGQKNAGHFVKIAGLYGEARDKMFELFGTEWAFQYAEADFSEWLNKAPEYMKETEISLEDAVNTLR